MWRSMGMDKKLPYIQLAKVFDISQSSGKRKSNVPSRPEPETETDSKDLCLPWIYVVRRNGTGEGIERTSVDTLVRSMLGQE